MMGDNRQLAFNIYCDESCHLEHDAAAHMILGALWSPLTATKGVAKRLRELKVEHGLTEQTELKWGSVSPSKLAYYRDVLDYFFDCPDVCFRALVASKSALDHEKFRQDHDTWYYKMYFQLLRWFLRPAHGYRIYLDQKDTQGAAKIATLQQVLSIRQFDFGGPAIQRVETVRSHQVEQVQLADFLTGIVSYSMRKEKGSAAKLALVEVFERKAKQPVRYTSPLDSRKVNIFHWRAQGE